MRIVYQETGTYWRDVEVEYDDWFVEDFKHFLLRTNSYDEAAIAAVNAITEEDIQEIMDSRHPIVYRYEIVEFIEESSGEGFSDTIVDYDILDSSINLIED